MPSTQKREARFRERVINGVLGREFLRAFNETVPETDDDAAIKRANATEHLVESYHAALLDLGVPKGFHNNYMNLVEQSDPAFKRKPPLACRVCTAAIEACRDYACNPKRPLCRSCATRQR
tara:strand:- start:103 stop:465 length:363 start_codon:yes stop_codon:yes gene_type:complete